MRLPRKRGATSVMIRVFIPDTTSTIGAGLTGLTNSSTNLTISYIRELDGSGTSYTGANIEAQTTIGTFQQPTTSSKIRFKAVDATNMPGVYELQFHDSATVFGTGDTSQNVLINIYEATTTALNIGPCLTLIPLVPWDPTDGVRMGMTALPNAAAEAAGGLYTRGSGSGQINQSTNGQIDADAKKLGGTTQTGVDLGGNRAEPGQGTPAAATSFLAKIDYLYKAWRNRTTTTATTYKLYNDDAVTVDQKAAFSDDGTTADLGEKATGP